MGEIECQIAKMNGSNSLSIHAHKIVVMDGLQCDNCYGDTSQRVKHFHRPFIEIQMIGYWAISIFLSFYQH